MKRITIIGLHLGYGGIENAIASFANNMCDKYDVTILSIYKLYNKPVYPIDERVHITYLINSNIALRVDKYKKLLHRGKIKELFKALNKDYVKRGQTIKLIKDTFKSISISRQKKSKTIAYLKKMDTDVVISTRDSINELVSLYANNNIKKIAWEHNHGDINYINHVIITCNNISRIVLVSKELENLYNENIKKLEYKLETSYIPNIVDNVPTSISKLNSKRIVSVGRLATEKGYNDLIDVFNTMYQKDKSLSLEIIGDGDQKDALEEKIKKYHLSNAIKLSGFKDKEYINNVLCNSSLFLMTSFTESFGIVLLEAMSNGVPCIAFDSAEGAREIIKDNVNGYLICDRNKEEMANKTLTLLHNKNKLKELGKEARLSLEQYNKKDIHKKWDEIL